MGSCRWAETPLPLAQRCLVAGWAAQDFGESAPASPGVSEPRGVSLPVALKFPLKCFFLFFKEKNIPKLENKGNPLPPNHTKLTLGAWRESMETRKPAVNPVRCRRVGWEPADPSPRPLLPASPWLPPGAGGVALQQRWGRAGSSCLQSTNSTFHLWPNLGRQKRRGSCTPGRPWGIQGLGQVGEPAGQLPTPCHTAESGPSPLTRSRNTQALWMLQSPGEGEGRTRIPAPSLPDASPVGRIGVRADRGSPWAPAPPALTSRQPGHQAWEAERRGQQRLCVCTHKGSFF